MSKEFDRGYDAGLQDGWYKGYRDGLKAAGVKLEENPGIAGNANRASPPALRIKGGSVSPQEQGEHEPPVG